MKPIRFFTGITCLTMLLAVIFIFGTVAAASFPGIHLQNADLSASATSPHATIQNTTDALKTADGPDQIRLLLQRGEAWRSLWMYHNAEADFTAAAHLARALEQPAPLLEIAAINAQGYVHLLMQNLDIAEPLLRAAVAQIEPYAPRSQVATALAAAVKTNLGNVLAARDNQPEALEMYKQALAQLAASTDQPPDAGLTATIHRNLASVRQNSTEAVADLKTAHQYAQKVSSPREKARLLISIAAARGEADPSPAGDGQRYHLLSEALEIGRFIHDASLISLASGNLGALYEERERTDDAAILTQQALTAARQINRDDLMLQWEWQWGRLLKAQGRYPQAIAAHQRALFHIDALHQDLPFGGQEGCISFQNTLSPVALGLADLLLQESGTARDTHEEQALLRQAQQAVETARQSELRDYFKDPCIDALTRPIERLSPQTAVLYPIILPDRLELLADIGDRLYRRTTQVTAEKLEQTVMLYAANLRNALFHKAQGQQIYTWVFAPFTDLLEAQEVDTLIFLPDGALRLIPPSALWTGDVYLAQQYALVTAPGLTLINPEPLMAESRRYTLLAGMSRPGPVVHELPLSLQQQMLSTGLTEFDHSIRGLPLKVTKSAEEEAQETPVVLPGELLAEHLQGLLFLPGVEQEIEYLSQTLRSQTLLNTAFERERFSTEMLAQNYRIVHIASHGFFGGAPEENFIMAYDRLINMNHLESYIKPKQFADHPVELLTLSACQTAEGDDRSPLGLSGLALKSGARSVLGSLWPVSDEATQMLLTAFYTHLDTPHTTKAAALQQAQMEMIEHPELNHPFFWAAFILAGNWL